MSELTGLTSFINKL